jgi:uncharacterized damage-inducible protein DinB
MRKVCSILVLAAVSMFAAHATAAQQSKAPKPAASPSQAVLDQWNDIGRKLTAMAEDFPEDKFDYKATPAQRTFAQNLLHVAGVNYFFTDAVLGKPLPESEDPPAGKYKTKAEIAAFVKKSFADGAAAIKAKGDKGMDALVVDPYSKQETRVSDFAYGFIEHSGEHYGQEVVYYRLNGLVPPESRPKK